MREIVGGRVYDTDKATLVFTRTNAYSEGSLKHRRKELYQKASGEFFLVHRGGLMTDVPAGRVDPMTPHEAYLFLMSPASAGGQDVAERLFPEGAPANAG